MNVPIGERRCLVTGAAGFIGANLAATLIRKGCDLHGVVRAGTDLSRLNELAPEARIHRVDLTDRESVSSVMTKVRPDVVFHAAVARSATDAERRRMLRTNIVGTSNVLEAAGRADLLAFVHLGSSLEYGRQNASMSESDPTDPRSTFGWTKAASTLLVSQVGLETGLPTVVLRPFYVYGPGEPQDRLVPSAIRAAFEEVELPLTEPGYRHDYVHVSDVVRACCQAAEAADRIRGEVLNVGSGRQTANEEVVELIERLSGRSIETRPGTFPAREVDQTSWVADVSKATSKLGWTPRVQIEEGLREEISWWLERNLGERQDA